MTVRKDIRADVYRELKHRPLMVRWLWIICAFVFLSAAFGGGVMMMWPVDNPIGLDEVLPAMVASQMPGYDTFLFETLFFPGLALVLCNCVCNGIALVLAALKKQYPAFVFAVAGGILLILWCLYEYLFLPNPLALLYWVVGIAQTILAAMLIGNMHAWNDHLKKLHAKKSE